MSSFDQTLTPPNHGLYECSKRGLKDGVDFYIRQGANDWNYGMRGAAQGGYRDLVDLFISKGADCWNGGMYYAAYGGQPELVEFFFNKGANIQYGFDGLEYGRHHGINWQHCRYIINFLYQKIYPTDYNGTESCSLCHEKSTEQLFITKCNHVFHRSCVMSRTESISCLLCGTVLP